MTKDKDSPSPPDSLDSPLALLPCPTWSKPTSVSEALEQSIEKWEYLSSGSAEGIPRCGLCVYFGFPKRVGCCSACPVGIETGNYACEGTPCEQWELESWNEDTEDHDYNSAVSVELALEELNFLKSLRKPTTKDQD